MNRSTLLPRLSFEYFPPKTSKGKEKLLAVHGELQRLSPAFVSVTYGAGGSTRTYTRDMVFALCEQNTPVAPHLSFGGDTGDMIGALLDEYRVRGIRHLVALRGDMPSGIGSVSQMVFAAELVDFIRRRSGDFFEIEVASYPEMHPQAKSFESDLKFLKRKFDAGANSGITQFFYSPDAYFYFVDACRKIGITQPIYPGIMPITNYQNLARFSRNCGADIPRWLHYKFESFGTDTVAARDFATDFVTRFCESLLTGGAPGLHFYAMNQIEPCSTICRNLGLG